MDTISDARRLNVYNRRDFAALPALQQLRILIAAGHLAPSTHNTQPWRFFLRPDTMTIDVFLHRPGVLPASDVRGRQAMVSIGCAIEHIRTAAAHYGFIAAIDIAPLLPAQVRPSANAARVPPLHVATIQLQHGDAKCEEKVFRAIFTRKVVRAEFDPAKPLPTDLVARAKAAIADTPIALHCVTDPVRRLAMAEFQGQADGYVINSPKFSRELGAWLLPNDTISRVGMPGNNFGLSDAQALRMHKGLLGDGHLEPEDGLRFAMAGKLGIEKSPLIAVLTGAADDPQAWIYAGIALERLLLLFTGDGVATAIHAGIVEVALINRIFAATLGTTRKMLALFRAGYPKRAEDGLRPFAPRLPLNEIILTSDPEETV
ncbi:MAG: hypothetical protein Q7R85_01385 [bacterium]|nr:hypothetical protein [bacterium]